MHSYIYSMLAACEEVRLLPSATEASMLCALSPTLFINAVMLRVSSPATGRRSIALSAISLSTAMSEKILALSPADEDILALARLESRLSTIELSS